MSNPPTDPSGPTGSEPSGPQTSLRQPLSETERASRNWSVFCHIASLATLFLSMVGSGFVVPLGFLGPLIVWLVKRNEYPAADEHGREATNFQLTLAPFQVLFVFIPIIGWFFLLPILLLINGGLTVYAAVKASNGESYRYPFSLRLIN